MTDFPRVTAILRLTGHGPDLSRVDPETLAAVRERGTAVHEAIEAEHYGFESVLTPEYAGFMDAYRKFAAETSHEPIVSEYEVVSRQWRVAGRLDRVGRMTYKGFEGRRTLIDFKSGATTGVEIQLAAYWLLWNEMHPDTPIERACAVALRKDGTYRVHPVDIKAPMACGFTPEQVWYSAVVNFWARGGK